MRFPAGAAADPAADFSTKWTRITDTVFCGARPETTADFKRVFDAGCVTVVSVDALPSDESLAQQFDLRRVHIPIGYAGASSKALSMLQLLATETNEPIFVHCHHGQHRGPAMAVMLAMARGQLTHPEAIEVLHQCGTSLAMTRLWDQVSSFVPGQVDGSIDLMSESPVTPFVSAMTMLDAAARESPSISLAQRRVLLEEGYREAIRFSPKNEGLKSELRAGLREIQQSRSLSTQAVRQRCVSCHASFRH
ncbi:MAG: hypothetical protein AAF539_15285 [Planctomycetota bacterium]